MEGIRHKTWKLSLAPEDQGIVAQDNMGLETEASAAEAQKGEVDA